MVALSPCVNMQVDETYHQSKSDVCIMHVVTQIVQNVFYRMECIECVLYYINVFYTIACVLCMHHTRCKIDVCSIIHADVDMPTHIPGDRYSLDRPLLLV